MRIGEHGLDRGPNWRACRSDTFTCRLLVLFVVRAMTCPASVCHAECAPDVLHLHSLHSPRPSLRLMQSNFRSEPLLRLPRRWRAPLPSSVCVSERGCIPFLINERCTNPSPTPPTAPQEGVKIRGYGLRPTRDYRRPCLTADI